MFLQWLRFRAQTLLPRGLRFPVPLDKGNGGSGDVIAREKQKILSTHAQYRLEFLGIKVYPFRGTLYLCILLSKPMHCAMLKSVLLHLTE